VATERAIERRATARFEAIAAAAGAPVALPAAVLCDGRVLPLSVPDADALLATVTDAAASELTVDVETTGYPLGHADFALRTVQLGNEQLALVLDPHEADQADVVRRHLAAAAVLHAHSATADLVPLAAAGLVEAEDAWSRMHDTVLLAKLADPASTGSDPGLKQLSQMVLGDQALSPEADRARAALFKAGRWLTDTKVTTSVDRSGWAQVDARCETMVRYAASDVLDDAAIATRLPHPEHRILERERAAQRMTARVAHQGLLVDGAHVARLMVEHQAARTQHADQVRALAAGLTGAAVDNPGSNQQVAAALERLGASLPRTATGRPSVAQAVLEPLRLIEGPIARFAGAVLDYRHHDTAIGTFLEPYQQLVQRGDGRARPTVYTLGADTGRMSCVRPNLQQVPREGGFRACITADPGHLLVSADFAGVELRVAAALSGDRNLRAILSDPQRDVHWEVARLAFGPQATKSDRYAVKRGVFGRIYGGGVGAIARGVGVSEPTAQLIIDSLDTMLPELSEWSRLVREAVKCGRTQFPTYAGRVAHLPPDFPHKAPNYCIQGTARELLVDALLQWADTPWGSNVLLPVHDELVVMVPEAQADEATAALESVMTGDLYGVPIKAEASTPSYAWSDSA
jgi:DNA polymerase I-like protein with 3'-5' exonuclease and polymerase domains